MPMLRWRAAGCPATLMAGSISQQIGEVTLTAMAFDPNDRTQNSVDNLLPMGSISRCRHSGMLAYGNAAALSALPTS